jgi:alpha-glucosidase
VDAGWRTEKWGWLKDGGDVWQRCAELCRYAAERQVGIILWHAFPEGRDDGPGLTKVEAREELFQKSKAAGVKGIKIDFFDSESKATVLAYEDLLRRSAKHQLMINFHGANKPTGETRTWPHEITREGIREQEYVLWDKLPLAHYGALPFTRMVAGHADFLPGYVRPKFLRNTTATFQMATAVVFTSPFLNWPDHPEAYLESPFLEFVRAVPTVWDETRVLDGSVIGEAVLFARRAGTDWYVGVMNCRTEPRAVSLNLGFLGEGDYQTTFYRDGSTGAKCYQIEAGGTAKRGETVKIQLSEAGGFVGRFSRSKNYPGW